MVYSDLSYAYRRLRDTVGEDRVSQGETDRLVYTHDFAPLPKQGSGEFRLVPDLVVLPKSTQEVVRVVRLGQELELPIIPRGGGTAQHAGSVPNLGGILLSTSLMTRVVEVDEDRRSLTLQAGATWERAAEAAGGAGLWFPLEPLLRRAATVGGHLSNGGVGIGAYKYGGFSRWVRSLEVVLPDGDVLETGEPAFDLGSQNYNLTTLFQGAEGTLGVITKATLKLERKPAQLQVAAYGFDGVPPMAEALRHLTQSTVTPYHVAFFDEGQLLLQRASQALRLGRPRRRPETEVAPRVPALPAAILLAFDGTKEEVTAEAAVADTLLSDAGGTRLEDPVAELFWNQRDMPFDARRISGGMVTAEALVPLSRLEEAIAGTSELARKMKMDAAFSGFLTDRSSALLLPYFPTDEGTLRGQISFSIRWKFHELVLALKGHPLGLGLLTTYNLIPMFGPLASSMEGIKHALDPGGFVNRGKLTATMGSLRPMWPFSERYLSPGFMRFGYRLLSGLRRIMPGQRYIRRIKKRGI